MPSPARWDWLVEQKRKLDERADRSGLRLGDADTYAAEHVAATGYTPAGFDALRLRMEGKTA